MNSKYAGVGMKNQGSFLLIKFIAGLMLFFSQMTMAWAGTTLQALDFSALSGDKLQLRLEMSEKATKPKVFQTDNPARIAMDFNGVTSNLKQKKHTINIGAARNLFVVEASGRLRVVVNLLELVPYSVRVEGNNVLVTMNSNKKVARDSHKKITKKTQSDFAALIPGQVIKGLDFRRGNKGEGRLLVSLSNPNTVVNAKEKGGKVILSFLNTKIAEKLIKRLDVSDFATPVKLIKTATVGSKTRITITPVDGNYEYSSFQSDGLLTVEFRPLTPSEKELARRAKFPFIGERLSLNFQNIEVRSVLQILADFTELNIIAADSVAGNVTLRLNDVPWDQALELILKSKGLDKRQSGNVVLVAPRAEISKIEKEEVESRKVVEQLEPLKTEYIQINYAKAENFRSLLLGQSSGGSDGCSVVSGGSSGGGGGRGGGNLSSRNNGSSANGLDSDTNVMLSNRGSAIVDSRTNILIVKETAKRLEEIRKLIQLLDKPVRQVLIESRIVIARDSFAQELGVRFGVASEPEIGGGKTFGVSGGIDPTTGSSGAGFGLNNLLTALGAAAGAGSGGSLALTLARGADYVLNLEISALQDEEEGEIVSNPRIMTSDRCQAVIKQGVQIPYQTVSQNGTQTELVDAVLELDVTPQITPSGSVIMDLKIKKDAPGSVTPDGIAIDTREIETNVHVNDGDTIVLGGVYESSYGRERNAVPWFADLPAIGWLFRKKTEQDDKNELLIFITPKIVKETLSLQ